MCLIVFCNLIHYSKLEKTQRAGEQENSVPALTSALKKTKFFLCAFPHYLNTESWQPT